MKKYMMLLVSAFLSVWAFWLISEKERWGASFQLGSISISVIWGAVLIFVLLGVLFLLGEMFTECPDWLQVFLVIAVVVAMILGPYYTDPIRANSPSESGQQNTSYRSYHTYYYFFGRSHSSGTSSTGSAPSINSKNVIGVIIAIVVAVLVIGTFVIPNFWVAVVLAFIGLYVCLTLAEFLKEDALV